MTDLRLVNLEFSDFGRGESDQAAAAALASASLATAPFPASALASASFASSSLASSSLAASAFASSLAAAPASLSTRTDQAGGSHRPVTILTYSRESTPNLAHLHPKASASVHSSRE